MRKMIALLLVLMLAVSFMTVAAAGFVNVPPPTQNGGDDNNNDGSGGNSGPVVGPGQQKEFDAPTGAAEETAASTEETADPAEVTTIPSEETVPPTVPTEEITTPTAPAVTAAAETQPNTNIVLGMSQQTTEISQELLPEEEPVESDSETYLLVALIAGIGAICAVLVIRRVLDV